MKKTLSLILALALMLGALGCAGVSAETAVEYPETVSVFTGLNEHLSKPLDLPLLLQAIHRCLHQ